MGKNRKNVESLLTALSGILSKKEPVRPNSRTAAPADRLAKLKDLRDKGLITDEEFQRTKADILSDI